MNVKRIISGVVLLAIVAIILILGNTTVVNITMSIVALLAINEYFNCIGNKDKVTRIIGDILAILIAFLDKLPIEILILIFPTTIVLLFIKVIITEMKTNYENIAVIGFGMIYIIGFLIFIPLLYATEHGKFLIWYLAIAAWGTDTFAYSIGIRFGKHKLTPISPKKSVEGSVGGIVGAVILSLIYTYIINKTANLEISYLAISGIAIILSILGEIGDLAASSIKRYAGIKDFSQLIPGHGGMLDRIDSILLMAPFAYFLSILI